MDQQKEYQVEVNAETGEFTKEKVETLDADEQNGVIDSGLGQSLDHVVVDRGLDGLKMIGLGGLDAGRRYMSIHGPLT